MLYDVLAFLLSFLKRWISQPPTEVNRGKFKYNGTLAETRFRLSVKRTSPFKSAGGRQFSRLLAAEVCASAVVMLDTPCSKVVWRVLATHSIRQFPLHFPSRASPCAITFQLESTTTCSAVQNLRLCLCLVDRVRQTNIYSAGKIRYRIC